MSHYRRALEKYAKYVIQESKYNLSKPRGKNSKSTNASGTLSNSLSYKIEKDRVIFESEYSRWWFFSKLIMFLSLYHIAKRRQ